MKTFNLIYQINSKIIETILTNKSAALCNHIKTQKLKTNQYKLGKLEILSVNSIKYNLPKTKIIK